MNLDRLIEKLEFTRKITGGHVEVNLPKMTGRNFDYNADKSLLERDIKIIVNGEDISPSVSEYEQTNPEEVSDANFKITTNTHITLGWYS